MSMGAVNRPQCHDSLRYSEQRRWPSRTVWTDQKGTQSLLLCQLETHYWVNRYDEGATFHPLCIETQEEVMLGNAWPWKQTPA